MGESTVEDGTEGLTSLSKKDTRGRQGTYSQSEEKAQGAWETGHTDLWPWLVP